MTVQVDVTGFSTAGAGSATTDTFGGVSDIHSLTLNVGSGPNGTAHLVLVVGIVGVGAPAGASTMTSVVWGSQTMTQIGTSSASNGDLWLFGLLAPATGTQTLVLTWSGTNQMQVGCASFVGVNDSSFASAFTHFTANHSSLSPNSVTVTTSAGDVAMAAHVTGGNYSTPGNIDIGHNNSGALNSGAENYDTATSPTLTYAFTAGSNWSSIGVDVVQFAVGPPPSLPVGLIGLAASEW
jgi:hypothetical protein